MYVFLFNSFKVFWLLWQLFKKTLKQVFGLRRRVVICTMIGQFFQSHATTEEPIKLKYKRLVRLHPIRHLKFKHELSIWYRLHLMTNGLAWRGGGGTLSSYELIWTNCLNNNALWIVNTTSPWPVVVSSTQNTTTVEATINHNYMMRDYINSMDAGCK